MPTEADQIATETNAEANAKPGGKTRLRTLADLDARTLAARRARELVDGLSSDLGGADRITVAERQLVQRAAVLGAVLEDREAALLEGKPVAIGDYLSALNALRRVLVTLGLERRARDVTPPSLSEYLNGKRQEAST